MQTPALHHQLVLLIFPLFDCIMIVYIFFLRRKYKDIAASVFLINTQEQHPSFASNYLESSSHRSDSSIWCWWFNINDLLDFNKVRPGTSRIRQPAEIRTWSVHYDRNHFIQIALLIKHPDSHHRSDLACGKSTKTAKSWPPSSRLSLFNIDALVLVMPQWVILSLNWLDAPYWCAPSVLRPAVRARIWQGEHDYGEGSTTFRPSPWPNTRRK